MTTEKRYVQQTRDKLVRDLTPSEAGDLLVHAHDITPERRKALLFTRGPAQIYFKPDEIEAIKAWIAAEDYFPAGTPGDWHPKAPKDVRLTLSARGPKRPRAPKSPKSPAKQAVALLWKALPDIADNKAHSLVEEALSIILEMDGAR